MRSELSDVLERSAERPTAEPDFADLARKGRRRRYAQRTTQGLAVVAAIALTAGVVLPRLNAPEVMFDSAPRGGVGTWENLPPAPIEPRTDAMTATDGRRVVVFGGIVTDENTGDQYLQNGAVYDTRDHTWAEIPAAPFTGGPPDWDDEIDLPVHVELLDDGRLLVVHTEPLAAGVYDFKSQQWTISQELNVVRFEPQVDVVTWAGDQLIVYGPTTDARGHGGLTWRPGEEWIPIDPGPLEARSGSAWAWTGKSLVIWGGSSLDWLNGEQERVFDDGASYDPVTRTWERLPDSPLKARSSAASLWTGEEWIVMGGDGASAVRDLSASESAQEPQETTDCEGGTCTSTSTMTVGEDQEAIDGKSYVDGARYNPSTGQWTPVAMPPKGAREYLALSGEHIEAQGNRFWARYDVGSDKWDQRPELPATFDFHATVNIGSRTVQINTTRDTGMSSTNLPRRIGGQIYNERAERWDPLAEAETPQRWGAAATPVGDNRYFVWGGASVTRDITQGYTGGEGVWKYHDDGALLTLD